MKDEMQFRYWLGLHAGDITLYEVYREGYEDYFNMSNAGYAEGREDVMNEYFGEDN